MNQELAAGSNLDLVAVIRDEIATTGPVTFARFMELAIGHPEHGYYATGAERPGTEGDFLTAPETHPIFGWTLANQVGECWSRLGEPTTFTVREFGAGSGTLAEQILQRLKQHYPAVFAATRYELQDLNLQRTAAAVGRLTAQGFAVDLASDRPITGMLLANELLDAFPFHRLILVNGELKERYVTWRCGWFADELGSLSDERLSRSLAGLDLVEGQLLEVSLAAQEWAAGLGEQLVHGYILLIDYGYPAAELYAGPRLAGTLKAYRAHQVSENPYQYVGRQDLTAHVDFTAISQAARQSGLSELGLTTQAYFVAGLGIDQLLLEIQREATEPATYLDTRQAVIQLLDPGSLGRFRVLALGKNVDLEPPLSGFSFHL